MKRAIVVLGLGALLAGCGTVDGLGQDISSGARTVQSWL
ncbi:entericidin EcnA/B family protein [Citreimonas sp.]